MTARSSVNSCGVRLPDGRNTPIPMLAEERGDGQGQGQLRFILSELDM